jgi:hypothetical protein
MWLVYLRFDDQGQVKTYHVTAESKKAVDEIYALAEQHGLKLCVKAHLANHPCWLPVV